MLKQHRIFQISSLVAKDGSMLEIIGQADIISYNIPLVADIHFDPSVVLRVAECFEKIRVNPGNFADRRAQFEQLEYTEEDYQKEPEHIEEIVHWRNRLRFPEDAKLSHEAKDLICRLLCDVEHRLGTGGSNQIKAHP